MEWTVIWKAALSTVLVTAAVLDLKTWRVPHAITWPLLLLAVASWILPFLLLALLLVGMLPLIWQILAISLLAGTVGWGAWMLNDSTTRFIALWWGIAYALWTLHVLGGGDVRIFMALAAFFPDSRMIAALWGGFLLVSVVWLLILYRRNAPVLLVQAGQGILGGQYPSREDLQKEGRPTTPGLALGALVYLWLLM
jgi:Flp pilus assembly protein protease CpaA